MSDVVGISIGSVVTKEAVSELTDGIVKILEAGHRAHMDQDTVRHALTQLGRLGSVSGNSVQGCSINMGESS